MVTLAGSIHIDNNSYACRIVREEARRFAGGKKNRARKIEEDEGMVLILLLLLLISGAGTYYAYRSYGKYGGLVPAMLVILLIYFLVGTAHFH